MIQDLQKVVPHLHKPNRQPSTKYQVSTAPNKVAVVLNGKAKAVTESLIRDLSEVINDETLFVSRSLEQSRFIARSIVNQGFDVVLCGGGDGTFSRCVTDIMACHPSKPPAFGTLRLGTGNALATSLQAAPANKEGLAEDLLLARMSKVHARLPLLRVEGKLAPFAGMGLDALILEDYNSTRRAFDQTPLEMLGQGAMGYALAIASRSLWKLMLRPSPEVTIRNEGAPTCPVDLQGRPAGEMVPRGGILYQGPVTLAAASTVPYYGLGLRMFPQAMMRNDRFQLRVGTVPAMKVLAHLPSLFNGEFTHSEIFDYLCTAVSIHFSQASPVQIGGDEIGHRTQLNIGLSHIKAIGRGKDLFFPLAPSQRTERQRGRAHQVSLSA